MMIIKILKACYTIKWYILSIVCFFILIRFDAHYISETYTYVFLLNIPAILIPYLVLWKLDALRYYNRALAICVFGVWFGYYFINYTIIKDEKAFMTDYIEVYKYIPSGKSSGINCRYRGDFVRFSTNKKTDRLYKIYGDSVINHIHVRLSIKKALPHVYYIDDFFIEYDED